jgi:hypothetical protein
MLLFKRIFTARKDDAPPDRRLGKRYCISPRFPLKAVVNLVGRDDLGHPLPMKDGGRDWSCRLINISNQGARIQLPPVICAHAGDACVLKLDLEGHRLQLPGRVAHMIERRDSIVYGVTLDVIGPDQQEMFDELIELIAIGSTFKAARPAEPLDAHYLIEQYAGEPDACLDVWRYCEGRQVAAFEFRLREYRVRGCVGRNELEFLPVTDEAGARAVPPEQAEEIHRLFHWVVPNLPTAVPVDVREFLQKYAA